VKVLTVPLCLSGFEQLEVGVVVGTSIGSVLVEEVVIVSSVRACLEVPAIATVRSPVAIVLIVEALFFVVGLPVVSVARAIAVGGILVIVTETKSRLVTIVVTVIVLVIVLVIVPVIVPVAVGILLLAIAVVMNITVANAGVSVVFILFLRVVLVVFLVVVLVVFLLVVLIVVL